MDENMDDFDSSEGIILVLGVTGAGKSYFLNQLKSHSVQEGHSLHSETRVCEAVQIFLDDDEKSSITVVDTPGFDDTDRPTGEILAEITDFMAAQHMSGLPLRGILYLHKITDNKMTGSSRAYLQLLESLVGDDALQNVILVTTMWNKLLAEDVDRARQREQELLDTFWRPMEDKGSYIAQFDGTRDSAYALIFQLAGKESIVLDIQKEIVDQDRAIRDTAAGTTLVHQLEKDKEAYQDKVSELTYLLERELQSQPQDKAKIRRLRDEKDEAEKILRRLTQSVDRMSVQPGSPMRQRMRQAIRFGSKGAVAVLGVVLNLTVVAVQLGLGGGGFV